MNGWLDGWVNGGCSERGSDEVISLQVTKSQLELSQVKFYKV